MRRSEEVTNFGKSNFGGGDEALLNELVPTEVESTYLKTLKKLTGQDNLYDYQRPDIEPEVTSENQLPAPPPSENTLGDQGLEADRADVGVQAHVGERDVGTQAQVPTHERQLNDVGVQVRGADQDVGVQARVAERDAGLQVDVPARDRQLGHVGVQARVQERHAGVQAQRELGHVGVQAEVPLRDIGVQPDDVRAQARGNQVEVVKQDEIEREEGAPPSSMSLSDTMETLENIPDSELGRRTRVGGKTERGRKRRWQKDEVELARPQEPMEKQRKKELKVSRKRKGEKIEAKSKKLKVVPPDTFLKCSHCGRTFKKMYFLSRHISQKHPDKPLESKKARCEICKIDFASISSLNRHTRRFHNEVVPARSAPIRQSGRRFSAWS